MFYLQTVLFNNQNAISRNRVVHMTQDMRSRHAEQLMKRFPELLPASGDILMAYSILEKTFFNGGTLFVCGNGGSASDAEHIVGELMKGFKLKRPLEGEALESFKKVLPEDGEKLALKLQMGLRAISLTGHPALTTAYMNDVSPEMTFAQQLFVLGREGDAVIGISTSGNSANVLNTLKVAAVKGIKRILFTGMNGGICEKHSDVVVKSPSKETHIIQEYHLPIYHALCLMLEERFYGSC